MKHSYIVYLTEFVDRKNKNIKPYYYIGSKTNCTYDGRVIRDRRGNVYYGSSTDQLFHDLLKTEEVKVHILFDEFDCYEDCLLKEKELHIHHDVVADPRYFNKSIATESNYSDPGFGTFRNLETGKFVRLPKDRPKVLNGEYVNANKGYKTYNNGIEEKQFLDDPGGEWVKGRLEKNILRGEDGSFYGKRHSKETIENMLKKREKTYEDDPERLEMAKRRMSGTASKTFKGVPKSIESNLKRSRKNMIMFKNRLTGECVRIHRDRKEEYDLDIWVHPFALSRIGKEKSNGTKWYTNGIDNLKLQKGQEPPEGYKPGRSCSWAKTKKD